MIQCWSHSTDL